jgi:site-specific recombinase XerD
MNVQTREGPAVSQAVPRTISKDDSRQRSGRRISGRISGGKAIDDYLAALERRRASVNTVTGYRRDLEGFARWCRRQHVTPLGLTTQDAGAYLDSLLDSGQAASTVERKLTSLRSFYRWLIEEDVIAADPTRKLHAPKRPQRLPHVVSESDVAALLAGAQMGSQGLRDGLVLSLLYDCGLRCAEVVGLELADVDAESMTLRVIGKGDKQRLVPFCEDTGNALRDYLAVRPTSRSRRLLLTVHHRPLLTSDVRRIVHDVSERVLGAGRTISPHALRHSYATHLLDHGADIRSIQELLGHASVQTTQLYASVSQTHMRAQYMQAHPRARRTL